MIDKTVIRKNFSRFAHLYDSYCSIQRLCAERLISTIGNKDFEHILDVGCGTGNYTALLRKKFPLSNITAVDISQEMVKIAQNKLDKGNIDFIISDAENFDFQGGFDLISSNVTLQWFQDLHSVLKKYKKLLNPQGIIQFSIFGPRTFYELQESLESHFGKRAKINSNYFLNRENLEKVLKKLFNKIEVKEASFQENYNSLSELLEKIRYTGVRGKGIDVNGGWTANTISSIEKIYKDKFGNVKANYQVFFAKGAK